MDTTREKVKLYRSDYRHGQGPHYAAPVGGARTWVVDTIRPAAKFIVSKWEM
jgi:hypothetical protein